MLCAKTCIIEEFSWYEKWKSRENKSWDVALHPSGSFQSKHNLHCSVCLEKSMWAAWYQYVLCDTFDQPLYAKAVKIIASSTDLGNVVVRLGGFHLFLCLTWAQSDSSWVAVDWELCGKLRIGDTHDDWACIFSSCASSSPDLSCITCHAAVDSRTSEWWRSEKKTIHVRCMHF